MAEFYTVLTEIGQNKIANAIALGGTIEITELAVGDGGGNMPTPDSSATALVNEVRRASINTSDVDGDNPSWIVVEQVIPSDVGGWTIREVGIFDIDGDLIGYGNYPETYKPVLEEGSSRTQTVRFVLEVSDTAAVTLKVDPSVVLATREYVDDQRAAHEASRNHPLATTNERGMVEKATSDEAKAGAADKFPDAADLLVAIDASMAFQNTAIYDTAGTYEWTVPEALTNGRRKAQVTVIGGGGGGRSSDGHCGGGGGGGIASSLIDLTDITSVSVTVGTGGVGDSDDGTASRNGGGSSSFGTYLSASGGAPGQAYGTGGGGGMGTGGDYNSTTGPGTSASKFGTSFDTANGGRGGGAGGAGAGYNINDGVDNGSPGHWPGGGGGGGNGADDSAGGAGADGGVIIKW